MRDKGKAMAVSAKHKAEEASTFMSKNSTGTSVYRSFAKLGRVYNFVMTLQLCILDLFPMACVP